MATDHVIRLAAEGFQLSEKALEVGEYQNLSFEEVRNALLNCDFRKKTETSPFLEDLVKQSGCLAAPIVVQLTGIANISMPLKRQNEDCAPRLLISGI